MEKIFSKPLQDILDDEIFADFFNAFLNLPVFGQTPSYVPVLRQWKLWPPLPFHKTPNYQGFLSWLQQHRLQLFGHSDLCMHYLLCQQLLETPQKKKLSRGPENVNTESPDRENSFQTENENTFAHQQMMRRCIGSVGGILRFRIFLYGTKGEELTSFWLIAAKILSLNEHNEVEKDECHSLYRILKVNHLSPGSAVLETCGITSASMLKFMSWHPPKARREILKQMQSEAFCKLQHYWVPAYISHCRVCLTKLPKGIALLEVHQQTGLHNKKLHVNPSPSIQLQKVASQKYSSKVNKQQIGHLMTSERHSIYLKSSIRDVLRPTYISCINLPGHRQSLFVPEQPNINGKDNKQQLSVCSPHPEYPFSSHFQHHTPIINPFPPPELESTKVFSDWLHLALKADAYAGHPFYSFLKTTGKSGAARLVVLWQDLAELYSALQCDDKLELCFLLTEQFFHHCAMEIKEDYNRYNSNYSSKLGVHITPLTMEQLTQLLPYREALPWILQAQCELSQGLRSVYEEFLDVEDIIFLQFVTCSITVSIPTKAANVLPEDKGEHITHRFRMALRLAQACSPGGNVRELDLEGFNMFPTEGVSHGSAVELFTPIPPVHEKENYNDMSFEDLALWNPKKAVEILSKQFQAYRKEGTAQLPRQPFIKECRSHVDQSAHCHTENLLCISKKNVLLQKPSARPRTLYEVLRDPVHLKFFRHFLRMNHAEKPLIFWLMVKKLGTISNPKQKQAYINRILQRFFQKKSELLQCDAVIIEEIPKMEFVSVDILQSAQAFVFKSMDEKWFKKYQGTFPDFLPSSELSRKRNVYSKPKNMKRAWHVFISFIRSICKFLRSVKNATIRKEFETFLQKEVYNDLQRSYEHSRGTSFSQSGFKPKDPAIFHAKHHFATNHAIFVSYLVNDLSFCIEVLRFFQMCDATEALASYRKCGLNSEAILHEKVNIIVKLFLACDTPPKLRINISESQRDFIQDMAMRGVAGRSMFHSAFITVFPIVIFFWKRFCTVRAMCGFHCRQTQKSRSKIGHILTKDGYHRIRSRYDYPILRFSLSKGIQLLLPNVPEMRYKAESADHLSPWKQNTSPTSLLLTPHSIMIEKASLRSPSRESSMFAHKV